MTLEQKKAFAKNVRHLKVDTGVTFRAIADKAGVSETYINNILRCDKPPSADVLMACADLFGVTIDSLLRSAAK